MGRNSLYRVKWEFLTGLTEEEKEFLDFFSKSESDGSYYIDQESLAEAKDNFNSEGKDLAKMQSLIKLFEDEMAKEDDDTGISVILDE